MKQPTRTRLIAAIAHAGSNQSELARKLGLNITTVHRWCSGKVPIPPSRWLAVTSVLGLSPDWMPTKKERK
jgi:DNA-binding transcriptional regulator YdaS (Cro superfamily)